MIVQQLEKIGFLSLFTQRIGPCINCEKTILTYYIPEMKYWICEECYYHNNENKELISFIDVVINENTMATPNIQELMARLDRLEQENRSLKAKSTDNVFVGSTDNLTLKNRQLSQRGWAVPTKNQQGQGFLRCGDFPMSYFLSDKGDKVILHTEIAVAPHEAQLFKERFLMQQMVVAKRRQGTDGQAPSAPVPAPTPSTSTPSTPTVSIPAPATGKSWATLPQSEKDSVVAEANGLVAAGLFPDLASALGSVLHGRNISK
jgi:hypothetical protein